MLSGRGAALTPEYFKLRQVQTSPSQSCEQVSVLSGSRLLGQSHFLTELFVFYQQERNLKKANYLLEGYYYYTFF